MKIFNFLKRPRRRSLEHIETARSERFHRRFGATRREKSVSRKKIQIALGIILAFAAIYVFFISTVFRVQTLVIADNPQIAKIDAEIALAPLLRSNIFVVNEKKTMAMLRDKFPTLKEVRIRRRLPHTLAVELKNYEVVGVIASFDNPSLKFMFNEAGYITGEPRENFIPPLYFYIKTPQKFTREKPLVPSATIAFTRDARQEIERNLGLRVISAEIFDIEEEVNLVLKNGWRLYFDLKFPYENQVDSLLAVLHGQNLEELNIRYVDLRIPGKVFVKTRDAQ